MRVRPTTWLVLAALFAVVSGCDASTPPVTSVPTPSLPYGTPIDPGPQPAPAACQASIRAEVAAAVRIRAGIGFVPGLQATEAAARAAAADPTSDTATLGIPVTDAELLAIRQSGLGFDPWSPIAMWVDSGAPERFGGLWLEGQTVFVTVVGGDAGSLALVWCVAPAATRTLWADTSQAEGRAIQTRIGGDMQGLRATGIVINMTSYDVKTGLVEVGVMTPTPEIEALLKSRYGPRIHVIQAGPIVLD